MISRKATVFFDTATTASAVNRDELQDRFFRLKEEHALLKKQANDAGNTVKVLTTKLSRLINEKKKLVENSKTRREVQMEEMIYDLQDNVDRLEKENCKLKNQSLLLRTQVDSNKKR
ncbi:protein fantom-like protein, partial [Leptotrombidium deliense]